MTIDPTRLALALSRVYGSAQVAPPLVPQRWLPCPECARHLGKRLSACTTCDGSGRLETR